MHRIMNPPLHAPCVVPSFVDSRVAIVQCVIELEVCKHNNSNNINEVLMIVGFNKPHPYY